MNHYYLRMIADEKIEEWRAWAASDRLTSEANPAGREARRSTVPPLVRRLRSLASVVRFSRPVLQPPDTGAHVLVDTEFARKHF
jgi:hypothetical protein